jgi:hypothetical protein
VLGSATQQTITSDVLDLSSLTEKFENEFVNNRFAHVPTGTGIRQHPKGHFLESATFRSKNENVNARFAHAPGIGKTNIKKGAFLGI